MQTVNNIAQWVTIQAQERPHQRALVFPEGRDGAGRRMYTQLTFAQTESMINRMARGFQEVGIEKGERVCVFITPCLEFMPIVFALYKIGAIVVLIDPGMGRDGLLSCVERIAPTVMVGVPKAMIATVVFAKKFHSLRLKITHGGGTWLWGGKRLKDTLSSDDSPVDSPTTLDDEASILFTSGSTGPAKGVRYTHRIFDAQTRAIKEMYGIEAGEIDLPCFPLFGLFTLAQGMTVVIPDMDPTKPAQADPKLLLEAIRDHGCTNAFASPALWKNMVRWCVENNEPLPTLKRVLSAGAPIPPQLHLEFRKLLQDGVEVHTPYGATESLPVATIGSEMILSETAEKTNQGLGTCVGTIAPNMTVQIIEIVDDPIEQWSEATPVSQGTIGEICVQGLVVTTEYKEEPQHTKMAKIHDGEKIWHRMGDVGYLDEQGRLWFCGRKKHRVVCSDGTTLFPVPCEAIFNLHEAVERSALVGVDGQPVIVIERRSDSVLSGETMTEQLLKLASENELTQRIQRVLYHPSFPVDVRHNAKIDRPKLARWAATQ